MKEPIDRGERILSALLLVLGAASATWVGWLGKGWTTESYASNITDSLLFRVVGEMLWSGQLPYDAVGRAQWIASTRLGGELPPFDIPFAYPPSALWLFALRGIGPADINFVVTVFVSAAVFLASVRWLSLRTLDTSAHRLLALLVAVVAPVAFFNGLLGQTGHVVGVLVIGALASPTISGLSIGLLTLVKPQYGIPFLLVLALNREAQAGKIAAITVGVVALTMTAAVGGDSWVQFAAAASETNQTLPFMASWMSVGAAVRLSSETLHLAGPAVFALGLGASAAACLRFAGRDERFAAVICVSWLFSPNTHPYDLCMAIVPILVLASSRKGLWAPATLAVGWLLLAWPMISNVRWAFSMVAVALFVGLWTTRAARSEEPSVSI